MMSQRTKCAISQSALISEIMKNTWSFVTNTVKQNTSTKAVSTLIDSDENIHDLCDFELTGNHLELNYCGSTSASFWMGALRWMLPVVVLIVIGLFLIRKKVAIREMFGDLKKELAESVNSLIDRINKR